MGIQEYFLEDGNWIRHLDKQDFKRQKYKKPGFSGRIIREQNRKCENAHSKIWSSQDPNEKRGRVTKWGEQEKDGTSDESLKNKFEKTVEHQTESLEITF